MLIPVQPSTPDVFASAEAIKAVRRARQIRNGAPQAFTFLTRVVPKTLLLNEAREMLGEYPPTRLIKMTLKNQIAAFFCPRSASLKEL